MNERLWKKEPGRPYWEYFSPRPDQKCGPDLFSLTLKRQTINLNGNGNIAPSDEGMKNFCRELSVKVRFDDTTQLVHLVIRHLRGFQ